MTSSKGLPNGIPDLNPSPPTSPPSQCQLDSAVAGGHREAAALGLQLEAERREAVRQRLGLEAQLAVVLLQLSEAQAGDSQRQSVVVGLQVGG